MKKMIAVILLFILLLSLLPGCGKDAQEFRQPVHFFYPERVREDGSITNVISPELREGEAFGSDLQLLLSAYLAGPQDPALYSPFPTNTKLKEVSFAEGKVVLRFSESFGALSSLDRTIACAAIAQTCMDFTGAEYVEVFAENTLFDGVESILISQKNLFTQDNTPIAEP